MEYENTKKLVETIQAFVSDLGKIKDANSQTSLSAMERKAVNELQLAQVEVEMAGRDLYAAVQSRRAQLRKGNK